MSSGVSGLPLEPAILTRGVLLRNSIIVGSAKNAAIGPDSSPGSAANACPIACAPRGSASHSPSVESPVSGTRASSPWTATTAVLRRSREEAPTAQW